MSCLIRLTMYVRKTNKQVDLSQQVQEASRGISTASMSQAETNLFQTDLRKVRKASCTAIR